MRPQIVRRLRLAIDHRGRLVRVCYRGVRCEERGCPQYGNPCWLPDDTDQPSFHFCYDHMHDAGFCPGCGGFWAGVESFDFSRTGYCENCASQGDYPDDDDWNDDFSEWDDNPRSDPWEDALSDCYSSDWGRTCGAAGSEDCEFECLIRRDYRRSLKGVTNES